MAYIGEKKKTPKHHPHEYADIRLYRNKKLTDSLNCRVQTILGDKILLLDQFLEIGFPKVLLISFMSEWCPNCHDEALAIDNIYNKFSAQDFEVIVVGEYSDPIKLGYLFDKKLRIQLPYVFGEVLGKNEEKKLLTTHHRIKTIVQDQRKWGVPLHIIIVEGKLDEIHCVTGEFENLALEYFLINQFNL